MASSWVCEVLLGSWTYSTLFLLADQGTCFVIYWPPVIYISGSSWKSKYYPIWRARHKTETKINWYWCTALPSRRCLFFLEIGWRNIPHGWLEKICAASKSNQRFLYAMALTVPLMKHFLSIGRTNALKSASLPLTVRESTRESTRVIRGSSAIDVTSIVA